MFKSSNLLKYLILTSLLSCIETLGPTPEDLVRIRRMEGDFLKICSFSLDDSPYLEAYAISQENPSKEVMSQAAMAFWLAADGSKRQDTSYAYLNVFSSEDEFLFQTWISPKTGLVEFSDVDYY